MIESCTFRNVRLICYFPLLMTAFHKLNLTTVIFHVAQCALKCSYTFSNSDYFLAYLEVEQKIISRGKTNLKDLQRPCFPSTAASI